MRGHDAPLAEFGACELTVGHKLEEAAAGGKVKSSETARLTYVGERTSKKNKAKHARPEPASMSTAGKHRMARAVLLKLRSSSPRRYRPTPNVLHRASERYGPMYPILLA